jgi:hypothetical protein
VQQKNHDRKSVVGKVRGKSVAEKMQNKNCGINTMTEKVRQKNHCRKSAAKQLRKKIMITEPRQQNYGNNIVGVYL